MSLQDGLKAHRFLPRCVANRRLEALFSAYCLTIENRTAAVRDSIQDTITRLIRFQRAPQAVCIAFRKLKHDADLLPQLQGQLETILDAYGKFQPIVYDTQGVRDDGSDVVLRINENDTKGLELLGFQVKSFDDLEKEGYLQNLKAQALESLNNIKGLSKYFIVLCTDPKAHKKRTRFIGSAFKTTDRTEVVEPEFAYTFLFMSKTRIEAIVKRTMEADDYVFKEALNSLYFETPTAKALAVYLSVYFVTTGNPHITFAELIADKALRTMYEEIRERQAELIASTLRETDEELEGYEEDEENEKDEDEADEEDDYNEEPVELEDFEPQLVSDIALLEDAVLESDNSSESYQILTNQIQPLCAVALDALVRYVYNDEQLLAYMFSAMGVRD